MSRDLRFLFTASTKFTKFSGAPSSEKIKKSRTIWKLTSFGYITLATCAVRGVHLSLAKAITDQNVVPAYLQLIFCNLLITGSSISSTIVLRTATNRCTLKEEKTLSPRREKASCGCHDSATIELEQRFDSPPNALQAFRYMFLVSFSERNCLDIRLRRKRRWDSLIFARNASSQIIPPRSCSYMAGKRPVGAPRHQGNPLIRDMGQINLVPVPRSVRIRKRACQDGGEQDAVRFCHECSCIWSP